MNAQVSTEFMAFMMNVSCCCALPRLMAVKSRAWLDHQYIASLLSNECLVFIVSINLIQANGGTILSCGRHLQTALIAFLSQL